MTRTFLLALLLATTSEARTATEPAPEPAPTEPFVFSMPGPFKIRDGAWTTRWDYALSIQCRGCAGLSQRDAYMVWFGATLAQREPSEVWLPEPVPACLDPTAGQEEWILPDGSWLRVEDDWVRIGASCVDPNAPAGYITLMGPTCGGGE